MTALREFIKQEKRSEILDLISRQSLMPLTLLFICFFYNYNPFWFVFGLFMAFITLITIPRWRRHFRSRFDFASRFIQILEAKSEELSNALVKLAQHKFPKELYWVDFKIDTSSFRIDLSFHSVNSSETNLSELHEVVRTIEKVISVDPLTISELRSTGEDAREKLDLSIDLVQRWFSELWTKVIGQDIRLRATLSVTKKVERYNLKSREWEAV